MRLNKYISETGLCSRREADARIEAGRVTLNGVVATLGMQVAAGDVVFPELDPGKWRETAVEHHAADERHQYAFTFVTLERVAS